MKVIRTESESNTPKFSSTYLLKYLWGYIVQIPFARSIVVLAFILTFVAKGFNVLLPIIFKDIINNLEGSGNNFYTISFMIATYGVVGIISKFVSESKDFMSSALTHKVMRLLGIRMFNHLHELSLNFHLSRKTGTVTRILERGMSGVENVVGYAFLRIFPTFLEILLVYIILSKMYGNIFGLMVIATIGLYVWVTIAITNWRTFIIKKLYATENEANHRLLDSIINYETVKYFNNEKLESTQYNNHLLAFQKAAIKTKFSLSLLNFSQNTVIFAGLIIILNLALLRVNDGVFKAGDLVLINMYLFQLYTPLGFLGFVYKELKMGILSINDMVGLLSTEVDVKNDPQAKNLKITKGIVELKNINFKYASSREVLKNINIKAEKNQVIAIIGKTGSGKSTVSRLLFRFYDPQKGSIIIDGEDIRNVTLSSLRENIGMVPQDTVMFNDTIEYNIKYGKIDATPQEIEEAAKMADIHDFILSLKDGYHTVVGERGLKLSGGERQRIALARVILKNAPIMIFDEATSALDNNTEKVIHKNIKKAGKSKTIFIIAHRLSTIQDANKIIVLDNGKIAEEGDHKSLLKKKGIYYTMWQSQKKEKEV